MGRKILDLDEARVAVRRQRKAGEKENPSARSFNRKHGMRAEDREELGARFHTFASSVGEPFDHPVFGVSYRILIVGGSYTVHYDPVYGTIFGRFDPPEAAKGSIAWVNPHSGKWNTHTSRGDDPVEVFESWRSQLAHLIPL